MTRIAIIEDDPPTSQSFTSWLLEYDGSFEVEQLSSRIAAESAIAQRHFDLVVLDISMGGDSNAGVGLIHDVGKRQNCPVIVVSGMPAEIYRGIMYQLEAWDYLSKPADRAALIAVVRNALKEKPPESAVGTTPATVLPDGLDLNPLEKKHPLWRGQRLILPMTAQRILFQIARSSGRPATFAELVKVMPYAGTQGAVKTHVSTIRSAFKAVDPNFNKIVNVPLVGYLWQE